MCSVSEAYLGLPKEKVTPVEQNHFELSRLPDRAHPFLDTFLEEIREVVVALDLDPSLSTLPDTGVASPISYPSTSISAISASLDSLGLLGKPLMFRFDLWK